MSITDFIPTIISSTVVAVATFYLNKKIEKFNANEIAYQQKKGENSATKEDINEITQAVEELKKHIEYNNQIKLIHSSDSYRYLIEFHNAYFEVIFTCFKIDIWKYTKEIEITNFIHKIDDLHLKFRICFHKVLLYNNIEAMYNMFQEQDDMISRLVDFVSDQHANYTLLIDNPNDILEGYSEKHQNYISSFRKDLDKFYDEEMQFKITSFRDTIIKYLPKPNEKQ